MTSTSYSEAKSPRHSAEAAEVHPLENCSRLSFALMLWMDELIGRGAKAPLQETDVWPLRRSDTSAELSQRFAAEWDKERSSARPRFHAALWRSMRRQLWCTLVLYFLYSFLMLLQPIVIKSLLQYMQGKPTTLGIESGYVLAAILTILSFVAVTVIDFGQLLASNLGCNAKCVVMDAVYQKSLRLSGFAKRHMSAGAIVTLSSVDSERLFDGFLIGPWSPTAPVSVLAIFIMIGFEMGYVVAIVGCVLMYVMLLVGYLSAKTVGETRRQLLAVQSERVKLTNEVLQGVRVVKMYAWEGPIEAAIARIRAQELVFLKQYHARRVFNTAALSIAPVICLAVCLLLYVALGNALSADKAFTVLAYMNVARLPCYNFSNGILFVQEAKASCDRVGAYLAADEVAVDEAPLEGGTAPEVAITNGDFSWHSSPSGQPDPSLPLTLRNITLRLVPKSLTIVVGAVGSGKSSLVSALLGEIHQVAGSRCVQGDIAYVSQEAWIQHDSLRNNVLFAAPMDESKYERVLAACQLAADLKMLPDGDATEIGERGINLSGGQKARVSLARAMYRTDADVVLLDDPLSALDVHVAGAVFRDCVQGLLADKTTLLVLNSHYHFLPHADRVLVMVDGAIAADGPFDVIKEQFPHLQSFSDVDAAVARISETAKKSQETPAASRDGALVAVEDRQIGAVASSMYATYLSFSGHSAQFVAVSVGAAFTISQAALAMLDWYMGHWANSPSLAGAMSSAWIYVGITCVAIGLLIGRILFGLRVVILCSKTLHERLFAKVLWAPVNSFFDVVPVGRILNRFSSDLDQVDSQIPYFGLLFLQFGFQNLAVVVVCAATSPYVLALYVPLFYAFYKLQAYYNLTSGELKRFDSVTKSPVANLISETVDGLSTIRAFKMTRSFAARSRTVLDHNQRFFSVYRTSSRWLQMRLDWLSVVIIAGVAFISIASKSFIGVTAAGLAITYAAQTSAFLSRTTMTYSYIENTMTCVERLEHYETLDKEGNSRAVTVTPPVSWPQAGVVQFDNYSMRYRDHLELVLKSVSFTVAGGHKVGICGRTGSGKSSLMVALFRM
ncbi:ATP-binding Cassette (ABC) Superfamily, partial [Achlya hypogyna]